MKMNFNVLNRRVGDILKSHLIVRFIESSKCKLNKQTSNVHNGNKKDPSFDSLIRVSGTAFNQLPVPANGSPCPKR